MRTKLKQNAAVHGWLPQWILTIGGLIIGIAGQHPNAPLAAIIMISASIVIGVVRVIEYQRRALFLEILKAARDAVSAEAKS